MAPRVFHDVTVGNNASPCNVGTSDCFATSSPSGYYSSLPCVSTTTNCTNNFLLAYSWTTAGYDLATGWGSVDAFNMINDWALVAALPTTGGQTSSYTALTATAASTVQGTSVTMTATVTSGYSTPRLHHHHAHGQRAVHGGWRCGGLHGGIEQRGGDLFAEHTVL